jgi:hypothetical protein
LSANYGGYNRASKRRKRLKREMRWLGMPIQGPGGSGEFVGSPFYFRGSPRDRKYLFQARAFFPAVKILKNWSGLGIELGCREGQR